MKALWHHTKDESRVLESTLLPNSTIVKSKYSLISLGTERLVATGMVPPALQQSMVVPYMEGSFQFPVKYGYSIVGTVVESNNFEVGTLIHSMHPHQDIFAIDAMHAVVIPKDVPAKRAILVANMETVINAVWDAQLQQGEKILVAGYGIIGAMLARICSYRYGCDVYVLEVDEHKKNLLKSFGYKDALSNNVEYETAFNCSANEVALQFCIDNVGEEGSVVELSWYGANKVNLELGGSFHSMRKKIISSQVSNIPKNKRGEWTYEKRKELAFDLLKDDFFDLLLDHEIPFYESATFFNSIRNNKPKGVGHFIKY